MQSIQLHAASAHESIYPTQMEYHLTAEQIDLQPNLDEALAKVLQVVRNSGTPSTMDALGTLLAYMENLEKQIAEKAESSREILLCPPLSLTL
jgi:hypothetical protein